MRMNMMTNIAAAALLLAVTPAMDQMTMGTSGPAMAATAGYKFELVGTPQMTGGVSIVSVKLMHNGKPVVGAIIIQSRADMGPEGMGEMAGTIKALPTTVPGIYRFEVQNGGVWNKPGKWALTFAAKVQGETATVNGSIIVELRT